VVGNYDNVSNRSDEMTSLGPTYAHEDLEVIIYHPLETGEGTNHDDTHRKTIPKTTKADVSIDAPDSSSRGFARQSAGIELADHDV